MSVASEIVARLKDEAGDTFRIIAGAAEWRRVSDKPRAVPAAYVVPVSRDPEQSPLANAVRQRAQLTYAVIIVASDLATPGTGSAAADDADALSEIVIAALLGWTPASASEAIQYGGGRLVDSEGGHVWWQDDFVTGRIYSSV